MLLVLFYIGSATYEPVACLLDLGWEAVHCRLDPLARPVDLAAAVAADGIAGHSRNPEEGVPAVAAAAVVVAAALAARSCYHSPVVGLGPSYRPGGCSVHRPIVHTGRAGHSRNPRIAGRIEHRSRQAVSPGARHLGRSAAVAIAADSRRTAAVAVAAGRPLVRVRDARQE